MRFSGSYAAVSKYAAVGIWIIPQKNIIIPSHKTDVKYMPMPMPKSDNSEMGVKRG
jgi:hypothetical protein